jgi:hypothetical protein
MPPGVLVKVHVPADGKPLNVKLPEAVEQFGCITALGNGADGEPGEVLMTTESDASDIHPAPLVTVKVNVPGGIPAKV